MGAEEGGVCMTASIFCCVYVNNSGKLKYELVNIHTQVGWLLAVHSQSPQTPFLTFLVGLLQTPEVPT